MKVLSQIEAQGGRINRHSDVVVQEYRMVKLAIDSTIDEWSIPSGRVISWAWMGENRMCCARLLWFSTFSSSSESTDLFIWLNAKAFAAPQFTFSNINQLLAIPDYCIQGFFWSNYKENASIDLKVLLYLLFEEQPIIFVEGLYANT